MKKVNFIFGIHNHQPIGNFDFVFKHSYEHAYRPFLDVLLKFPDIKVNIHFTGILLEWIEKNQPECFENINTLIKRGQIELLTGGFYEPILPLIPDKDKVGQILKLTKYIKKHFDYTPRGMWLAERVWEQNLVRSLNEACVEYVVLDDSHFIASGISRDVLDNGYFITEDSSKTIKLIPIDKGSRYVIPFDSVDNAMEYLFSRSDQSQKKVITMADDGEKFGDWPGTFHSVYEEKWLERFFAEIINNKESINMMTFSEMIDSRKATGLVYLNNASYSEMLEWALPPDMQLDVEEFRKFLKDTGNLERFGSYIRGGYFRNFLFKYNESNSMHKRMLIAHEKVHMMKEGAEKEKAIEHLYASQCNCPYWHGVFGGLYLPHLRDAIYENIIKAEKIAYKDDERKVEIVEKDIDLDGDDEIIFSGKNVKLFFKPHMGGSVFEADHLRSSFNFVNTLSRKFEKYHNRLLQMIKEGKVTNDPTQGDDKIVVKEKDLDKILNYDWYRRGFLIDHFVHPDTNLENFSTVTYGEQGDFVVEPFDSEIMLESDGTSSLLLSRTGNIWVNGVFQPVYVSKKIILEENTIKVDYTIRNISDVDIDIWNIMEMNFSMLGGHSDDKYYSVNGEKLEYAYLDGKNEITGKNLTITDEWKKVSFDITSDKDKEIWTFPIETVSLSEGGFEKIYQSSVVALGEKINLKKAEETKYSVNIYIGGK
ncbi:MAG: 4-alpha-glucanotransferase [Candidatus Muiribacterium halophilum]|uniref:4-alpha-glucanotransferase n=1 Tax=Muiribacterium halophilum TaxID=2053465 RepID=A0A2N5ZI82_MUIH1|nr:MAG: 4-alpha-glucanotransferase [Candidatus Muirbacterium halophilum]